MLLIGPNPKDGDTRGEFRTGLMTEKGEPNMLVGLLDPELFCCEDMATAQRRRRQGLVSQSVQLNRQTFDAFLTRLFPF